MSAQRQHHILFTEAEYRHMEDASPIRHEFFRGEIYAMAGATFRHNDVAANILAVLKTQLRGRPCRARMSDQRIRVEATTLQTYPDVVVVCPPFRVDPNSRITLLDVTVLVEVLSPGTRAYDRDTKWLNYRELPSLRHYLLVEPEFAFVEHRFRVENEEWQPATFSQFVDEIELRAIECTLSLAQIYEEIEFDGE